MQDLSELINTFSYSHSRGDLFRSCPRRYWFVRYGTWGGWEGSADPLTREIYRLNKLSNRYLWTGHHVHERVGKLIDSLVKGQPLPPVKEVRDDLLKDFRREFAHSKNDRSGRKPVRKGFFGLLEHDSPPFRIGEDQWKPLVDRALEAVEGFYRSWPLPELSVLPPSRILERDEELRTFPLEVDGREVPVHLKIDLAYESGDQTVHILDWKTGKPGKAGEHASQLGLYAWYFERARGIRLERMRLGPVYLAIRPERQEIAPVTREEVESVLQETRSTIREILSLVEDPDRGVARKEAFPVTGKAYTCRDCPFAPHCEDRP